MNIQSIESNSVINNVSISNKDMNSENSTSFSKVIGDVINNVNDKQIESNSMIDSFIKGEDVTMHDVMLSMQESQMSMQLLIELRNKIVEAYQEINKVQL